MKRVKDVLERHSEDHKKLKVLKKTREELERVLDARRGGIRDVEQIDDKVREIDRQIKFVCDAMIRRIFNEICDEDETSTASLSSSEFPEDETLSPELNIQELKQTLLGQGGIGKTKIINSNSKMKFICGNVQIEHNYYEKSTRRKKNEKEEAREGRGKKEEERVG